MKTTKEMIEVMKERIKVMEAFDEGKEIEYRYVDRSYNDDWEYDPDPVWNWDVYDYHVKPKKEYRPYKDTEEMLDDFCERFKAKRTDYGEPFIWIKSKSSGVKYLVEVITDFDVWTSSTVNSMADLFEKYTYKDGSPCGKEVEE